jgi:hypothetical protein
MAFLAFSQLLSKLLRQILTRVRQNDDGVRGSRSGIVAFEISLLRDTQRRRAYMRLRGRIGCWCTAFSQVNWYATAGVRQRLDELVLRQRLTSPNVFGS